MWCVVNAIKITEPIFWEHKCSLICHTYTDTIVERLSDGGRMHIMNFPNQRTQQLTAQTVLCVLTLLVVDNSKQKNMAPSFSRPDPQHLLHECVWNYEMHGDISHTEVNRNKRIEGVMSPTSPAKLRLAMNNVLSNVMCVSEQMGNISSTIIVIEIN
jgi:hypothetical protein